MIPDLFTQEVDNILYPIINKLEYGRLRKTQNWPVNTTEGKIYNLGFDKVFLSTDVITMILRPDNTVSFNYMEHSYSIEEGLKRFKRLVRAIPEERVKKTIKIIDLCKKRGFGGFEEMLQQECRDLKKEETDIYTPEELKTLRDYFSK